jgi:hypothetical protein
MISPILPAVLKNIPAKCVFTFHDLIKIIDILNGGSQYFFIQQFGVTIKAVNVLFSTLGHPFQIRLKAWNNSTCSSLVSNTLSYDSTGLISILIFWIDLAISIAFSGLNPSFFSFNCLSSSL